MANITWAAIGKRGHVSLNILQPRSQLIVDLQNASYNDVKIRPSIVFVDNSANDGGVQITLNDGIVRTVPAKTNYRVSVVGVPQVKILNTGRILCKLYFLDHAGETESDITLAVGDQSNNISVNDFLFPMESPLTFTNAGVEPASNYTLAISAGIAASVSTVKFGVASCNMGASTLNRRVLISDAAFFNLAFDTTLDFWFYNTAHNVNAMYFAIGTTTANNYIALQMGNLAQRIFLSINGVAMPFVTAAIPNGAWHFLRFVKTEDRYRIIINGAVIFDVTSTFIPQSDDFYLGAIGGFSNSNTLFDEVRYSKGFVPEDILNVPVQPFY